MDSSRINRGERLSTLKLTVVQYGILVMMLALAAGLWRLQILDTENFRLQAEQNRVRKEPVLAPRGKLFDRENRLVVDNYPSISCFLVREQNRDVDADLPLIAKGLNLDLEQLRATLRRYRAAPGYQPIPIKLDITEDERPSSRRTATNCPSWRPSTRNAASIPAMALPLISSATWAR